MKIEGKERVKTRKRGKSSMIVKKQKWLFLIQPERALLIY